MVLDYIYSGYPSVCLLITILILVIFNMLIPKVENHASFFLVVHELFCVGCKKKKKRSSGATYGPGESDCPI